MKRFLAVLIALAVFAVPAFAQFRTGSLPSILIPTVAILVLLLTGLFFALGYAMPNRKIILRRWAKYMLILTIVLLCFAVVGPVLFPSVYGSSPMPIPLCGPGTESVNVANPSCDYLAQYECHPFDPLGGQACDSSNYTMCRFGCACSAGSGGHCLRHEASVAERETCACVLLINVTGCPGQYQPMRCCLTC